MQLSDKQRRMLRWVGYPALALMVFFIALHLTFPYDRVKDKLVEVMSAKYDVAIGDVGPGLLPGDVVLENVSLRTRPTEPDEEPAEVVIDRIDVGVRFLPLLAGRAEVDIEAVVGNGSIEGNVELSRDAVAAHVSTRALPLASLPGVRDAVGLPASGELDATVDIRLPEGHWDQADGRITLSCPGCTVGDGTSRIKPRVRAGRRPNPRFMAFAGEGVTVPELDLGDLSARIVIKDGKGTVEEFAGKSKDGELALKATVQFARQFKDSRFESGCMKFRLSDELKRREPKFGSVPELMIKSPVDAEGFTNVKLTGKLMEMRWRSARSCDVGEDDEDDSDDPERPGSGPLVRPTISSTPPSEPLKPAEDAVPGSMPPAAASVPPQPPGPGPMEMDPGLREAAMPEGEMGAAGMPPQPARRWDPDEPRGDDMPAGMPPEPPYGMEESEEPLIEEVRGEPEEPLIEEVRGEEEGDGPEEEELDEPREFEGRRGVMDEYEEH